MSQHFPQRIPTRSPTLSCVMTRHCFHNVIIHSCNSRLSFSSVSWGHVMRDDKGPTKHEISIFRWRINVSFDKFKPKQVPKSHRVNIDFDKCLFLKHIPSCFFFLASLLNFQHIYGFNVLTEMRTESVHPLPLPYFSLSRSYVCLFPSFLH